MRRFPINECLVEITIHASQASPDYKDFIVWLVQTDDDRRFEVGEREEATEFTSQDAAIGAAETYLVETAAGVERSGKPLPEVTYRVVRW
jgi:hypothetical protein